MHVWYIDAGIEDTPEPVYTHCLVLSWLLKLSIDCLRRQCAGSPSLISFSKSQAEIVFRWVWFVVFTFACLSVNIC